LLLYSLRLVDEDPRFRGIMALFLYQSGASPELEGLREARMQRDLLQMQQIAAYFRVGVEQDELLPTLDVDAAAYAFLAYQNGLVSLRLLAPGALSKEHDGALADIFVRGVARAPSS
jgi:AcrR family transcriptional regulator